MANAPVTSITLLKGLASGTDNARWAEFFHIYEQPMRSFLQSRFPSVDADDAIQETMVALTRRMPDYHYTPDRNGHFHNYLTGILKHKAEDALRREARESGKRDRLAELENPSTERNNEIGKQLFERRVHRGELPGLGRGRICRAVLKTVALAVFPRLAS